VSAGGLAREARRLVDRVSHWTPSRWAASSTSGVQTRADLVYSLIQALADLDAEVEGEPRRVVPRLKPDDVLVDQLRVLVADLLTAAATNPAALTAATAKTRTTHQTL
jgi:hypothetical protein